MPKKGKKIRFEDSLARIPEALEWAEKQDVEKLREERRNRGKMFSDPNPLIAKSYPQFPPGEPFPPVVDEPQEGSPDDLPF